MSKSKAPEDYVQRCLRKMDHVPCKKTVVNVLEEGIKLVMEELAAKYNIKGANINFAITPGKSYPALPTHVCQFIPNRTRETAGRPSPGCPRPHAKCGLKPTCECGCQKEQVCPSLNREPKCQIPKAPCIEVTKPTPPCHTPKAVCSCQQSKPPPQTFAAAATKPANVPMKPKCGCGHNEPRDVAAKAEIVKPLCPCGEGVKPLCPCVSHSVPILPPLKWEHKCPCCKPKKCRPQSKKGKNISKEAISKAKVQARDQILKNAIMVARILAKHNACNCDPGYRGEPFGDDMKKVTTLRTSQCLMPTFKSLKSRAFQPRSYQPPLESEKFTQVYNSSYDCPRKRSDCNCRDPLAHNNALQPIRNARHPCECQQRSTCGNPLITPIFSLMVWFAGQLRLPIQILPKNIVF